MPASYTHMQTDTNFTRLKIFVYTASQLTISKVGKNQITLCIAYKQEAGIIGIIF